MSQYIPGIVDYIPQIQPYKPDLNFFQQVLETKESQYKAGYDKISGLYGELLDSPLSRSENVDLRNKFFQDISSSISKISGLDLSLNQNIEAAQKVFQPLIDNNYILKDMAFTKQGYNAIEKGLSYKDCIDEKKCGGKYWDGGIRLINYQMEDFAKSSAEESLKFNAPDYTPAVNLPKKALEFAKEMGFNMKTPSFSADGKYQITTKNGVQMIPSLTETFLATFKNDQSAVDYYKAKASLDRYDWAFQNADQHGGREAAENFYLDQLSKSLYEINNNKEKKASKNKETARVKKGAIETVIKGKGVDPEDDDDKNLIASHSQSIVDDLILSQTENNYSVAKEAVGPVYSQIGDLSAKRARLDSVVADSLFQTDLYEAAKSYALNTEEVDIKADPYSLASFEYDLSLKKMKKQNEYDVDMENLRTANELLKEGYKTGKGKNALGKSDNPAAQGWTPGVTSKGGTALEINLIGQDAESVNSVIGSISTLLASSDANNPGLMNLINNNLNAIITNHENNTSYKGIKVTDDLAKWAKDLQQSKFGTYTDNTITVKKEDVPWYKDVANFFLPESKEYVEYEEKTVSQGGGYLDKNRDLIKDASQSPIFTDPNGNHSWWKVAGRMDEVLNDPIYKKLFGDDTLVKNKKGEYDVAATAYKATEKTYKDNLSSTHSALLTSPRMVEAFNKLGIPNAKELIKDNYVNKNGYITDKESFVKTFIDNNKTNTNEYPDYKNPGMVSFGPPGSGSPVPRPSYGPPVTQESRYQDMRDDAETLYDMYTENFQSVYNNLDDAPAQNLAYKPISSYINTVTGEGRGVETRPISISNLDSAYPGDLGANDFRDIYRNARDASLSNPESVYIIPGDGADITEDVFDDNDSKLRAFANTNNKERKVLDYIYSQFNDGNIDIDDKKRARIDVLSVYPITANKSNKVAFTIRLNSDFRNENQGSPNKDGVTKGLTGDVFTIVMDKEDVTANAYKQLSKSLEQTVMDAYGEINVNAYSKWGGEASIKQANNGYSITGHTLRFDPSSRTFYKEMFPPTFAKTQSDLHQITGELNSVLEDSYIINSEINEQQSSNRRITDPNIVANLLNQ